MKREPSALRGMLWMILISILLFWLPFFGPLIAGFVGGKKAGTVGSAILAVFLPAILIGVFLFFFGTVLSGIPGIGLIAGMGGFVLALAGIGPLLIGAIIGGAMAE